LQLQTYDKEDVPNNGFQPTSFAHRTRDVACLFIVLVKTGCLALTARG
jgi:hypothetical protein